MNADVEHSDVRRVLTESMPIYATGKLRPHIPDVSIEREITHAANHMITDGRIPEPRLHEVLSKPENRYLARKMVWFFDLDCGGCVRVRPTDPSDIALFTKPLHARTSVRNAFEVIVGVSSAVTNDETQPPVVICDQVMTVSLSVLVDSVVAPKDVPESQFRLYAFALARQLFEGANRYGLSDSQRALTFLMLRNSIAYDRFARHRAAAQRLVDIGVRELRNTRGRKVLEVGFVYEDAGGAMERDAIAVDVTQEFPFVADTPG